MPSLLTVEDGVIIGPQVNIGNDIIINLRSIILYNANIRHHVVLGPLTLVWKGENIPTKSAWIGSPAVPWVYK